MIKFHNLNTVVNSSNEVVVMNRHGEIAIQSEEGRDRERYTVLYGAKLMVKDGQEVKAGKVLAEWDPYNMPILTDVTGKVKFGDISEGVTIREQVDEVTGFSRKVVISFGGAEFRPRVTIKDENGKTAKISGTGAVARYLLPVGANIMVAEGEDILSGMLLLKSHENRQKQRILQEVCLEL